MAFRVVLLALAVTTATAASRLPRAVADACGTGLTPGDTIRFVGVNRSRPGAASEGEVRIWADSANHIRYMESFVGSAPSRWEGEIVVSADATPQRFVWRSYVNDMLRNTQSTERIGDSVISVNGDTRTAERLPTGVLRFPKTIPGSALEVLSQCALARGLDGLRTAQHGVLRMTKGFTTTIRVAGATKTVSLYALSADSAPYLTHLWLDEQRHLFAHSLSDIGVAMPREWAPAVQQLLVAEAEAAAPRMQETATDFALKPDAGIVFANVRVIDVERGTTLDNVSVVVRGSRIVAVGPTIKPPAGAKVIDATGKTLMPGLWNFNPNLITDSWGATYDDYTRSLLSLGVTSVYNIHGDTVYAPLLVRRLNRAQQVGPQLLTTCALWGWVPELVDGRVSRFRDAAPQVKDREDVRRLIARCAAQGRKWINLFGTFPPELVRPAIAEAHGRGLRVAGGGVRNWSTQEMLDAGVDGFAHVGQSLFAMVPTDTSRTAWDLGRVGNAALFWAGGRALAELDLDSPAVQRVVSQIVRRRLPLGTSLCAYPPIRRDVRAHDTTWDAAIFKKLTEYVALLHREGATFVPGSEGCSLTRELQLLSEIGFTNAELISLVTIGASRFAELDRELGTIAVGKRADLILIDGDPLTRLADLDRVTMVMRDGALYRDLPTLRSQLPFLPRPTRR
jgi:hypothetical protein